MSRCSREKVLQCTQKSPFSKYRGLSVYSMNKTGGRRKMVTTRENEARWYSSCSAHCKKELAIFPSPAGMSLTKHSLGGKKLNYSRPGRVWSVTSRLGTGKRRTLIYSAPSQHILSPLLWGEIHGTEFRVVYASAEGFGTEFRVFASIFVRRNEIPSCFLFRGRVRNGISRVFCSAEQPKFRRKKTICSVYSVFRGIIFLSEILTPTSV